MQKDPFSRLKDLSLKATLLNSIDAVLAWDQETYLPKEALESRSNQLTLLAGLIHKQKTSSVFTKNLSKLVDLQTGELKDKTCSKSQQACLREWRRDWLQATKLPSSFVKKFTNTASKAVHVWAEARQTKDFSLFLPHLNQIVLLCQKKADFLTYQNHPYDALLDLYEPGSTVASLTPLFATLKSSLLSLLQKIHTKPSRSLASFGPFPSHAQMKLGEDLLQVMGFSKDRCRLDLSSHPFCTGIHPNDIRMTTRIEENNPINSLLSVLHEGGHGLYHTNLPKEHYGTPLCEAASYGIDESQSRLFETIIGKGLPFWSFFYPRLQKAFPTLSTYSLEDFYALLNQVEPSLIRVDADEVTYCLHIILRFELEKGLMEGSLKAKDLPELWNKKMQEFFSITPKHDGEGCLQDIHWAMGGIGYFPTYILGNLFAAQIFATLQAKIPSLNQEIAKGHFSPLTNWLKENLYQHGKIYAPEELVLKVTAKPLAADDYIKYLENKFLNL